MESQHVSISRAEKRRVSGVEEFDRTVGLVISLVLPGLKTDIRIGDRMFCQRDLGNP